MVRRQEPGSRASNVTSSVIFQRLDFDILNVVPTQRNVIALDKKLDRIAQRSNPLDQDSFATHKAHFHQTPSNASATSNP
jgi:hypothetical protein